MKPRTNRRPIPAGLLVVVTVSVVLAAACGQRDIVTANALAGTRWEMTAVLDGGVLTSADPTTIATLVFADASAGGFTGCNLFRFAYSVERDSISFGDPALTGSACEPDYVDQGDAMVRALAAADRFAVSGNRLELTDAGGTVQAQFRPANLLPLTGIEWRLVWYGEGTAPLDGSVISLSFLNDATLTGFAGCNAYSAVYRTGGDRLTIEGITRTERACLLPDGVMNQEADYLEIIRQSTSFTTTLSGLELRDAGGHPMAGFRFGGRIRDHSAASSS